jgi:hypothetical protein
MKVESPVRAEMKESVLGVEQVVNHCDLISRVKEPFAENGPKITSSTRY